MKTQRALVTNSEHYVATVIYLILAGCVAALILGLVAGG